VRISGHGHTLSAVVSPQTILPGATVNLRLTRLRGTLPRGRHRVGVRLTQAGHPGIGEERNSDDASCWPRNKKPPAEAGGR